MFPAERKGEWEALKVRERKVTKPHTHDGFEGQTNGDVEMGEGTGMGVQAELRTEAVNEEETLYEEDPTTDDGAVWPIRDGRVVDWSCFFALLSHVHETLSPPLHTPILIVSQPAWTAHDHEILTQYIFEKFRTPAFCLMDSALAACYAYATATATVVDIGLGKCDVTAVSDFVVNDLGRGAGLAGCGGDAMTQRLRALLIAKGFTKDMCEQLKKNPACEVLPVGMELPGEDAMEDQVVNPAAVASTGATGSGEGQGAPPRRPGLDIEVGDEDHDQEVKTGEDNEGVLDVASIVASGKTSEFLARKDKEKLEKAAAKKAAGEAAAANRQAKLPNSKRVKATFQYTERRPLDELNANGKRTADGGTEQDGTAKRQRTPDPVSPTLPDGVENIASARKEERRRNKEAAAAFVRKDLEVGLERFQAASGGILDEIADAIHRAILSVPNLQKRPELWDSLIFAGNGSKVKGKGPPPPTPPPRLHLPPYPSHHTDLTLQVSKTRSLPPSTPNTSSPPRIPQSSPPSSLPTSPPQPPPAPTRLNPNPTTAVAGSTHSSSPPPPPRTTSRRQANQVCTSNSSSHSTTTPIDSKTCPNSPATTKPPRASR